MIQQDKNRIEKKLYSSHPTGTLPVLQKYDDADKEADGIASQITTLTEDLGSELVSYQDFAILLRAGYQSLSIELALQKAGIPCIFRGGHKFFERTESVEKSVSSLSPLGLRTEKLTFCMLCLLLQG